ncbi:MAG TPA: glycosyltransferase family A protein [Candidatus Saccharimonadales bacterium]|nr:glycosyltransferase family A protein [Candidatus Saccharimonadales bacterium]
MTVKSRRSVSIVIPARNEERHLGACLEAIARQTVAPYEVIVVDNNSTDKTAAITSRYPFVVVVDEEKEGIVHARDAGFDAASGDIIGRIDADIKLPPTWVEHVQGFYGNPGNASSAWVSPGFFYNVRLPRLVSGAYTLMAFGLNKVLLGHYSLWGSSMAITAQQWAKVRKKTCRQTDIHEDLDLAMHLHEAGFGIHLDRRIKVRAELRRVNSDRHKLWDYLNWWPRTLRAHGKKAWPLVWFVGVFLLYGAATCLAAIDAIADWLKARVTSS